MQPDVLLEKKSAATDTSSSNETSMSHGLYLAGLDDKQLNLLGIFFNEIYEKIRNKPRSRQITRNALTMFQGAIFALGSKKDGNIEWKEHCASSLREIIHEWEGVGIDFAGEFREFYPNSPKAAETEVYKNFKHCYGYFSGIGHHNASGIMGSLSSLRKDSNLKLEDCYQDEIFLETVKKFFSLIFEIVGFSKITPPITNIAPISK